MSLYEFNDRGDVLRDGTMQRGLPQPAWTVESQVHAQHAECPVPNHLSPQAAPAVSPLQHHQPGSPNLSTDTPRNRAEVSDDELTPPTSSSGFSSQEKIAFMGRDPSMTAPRSVKADPLGSIPSTWLGGSPTSPQYSLEPTTAAKRTSSGQVKRSSALGVDAFKTSPGSKPGHSRTSSLFSNGSSVTDLSQQLRTRLSYAMVKVQNGWESNTLEELESLTSRHASPKASPAAFSRASKGQLLQSPSIAPPRALWRHDNSSTSNQYDSAANASVETDHLAQEDSTQQQTTHGGPERRALAPPADIVPGTRRRPHHANGPLTGHRSAHSSSPTGPRQRTASQNAAMEADAVETLLFMASPGNSGHRHSSSWNGPLSAGKPGPAPSQTWLKSEKRSQELFPSPKKRGVFGNPSGTLSGSADISSPIDDVDRMIDEVDDTSNDSGLEYWKDDAAVKPGVQQTAPD